MEFKAIDPKMKVNGQTIMSVVDGMGTFGKMGKEFLVQAGLPKEIDLDGWYSQQAWLDAFKLIAKKIGPKTLTQIGIKIPENAKFPPTVKDVESALAAIDVAYHMNHQNAKGEVLFNPATGKMLEGIGHYKYEKVSGKKEATITCNNPYPCDFDLGIISTMAKKFNKSAQITHDDKKPCRKKGAETCTYIVKWS